MDSHQTKPLPKRYFGKHHLVIPPDSLLEFQRQSYDNFIKKGIKDSFNDVFPISDYSDKELSLEFIDYYLEEPKFSAEKAREKDLNYNAALRVTLRLVNKRTGEKKDQEVYFGDIPILTETGTFIVNGNERAIVSQLIKSPGTIFTVGKNNAGENRIKAAVTPHRGAWLEFNTENDGYISAKIDRKKKVMATIILKAFGVESNTEIKKLFADVDNGPLSFIDETLKKDYTADQNEALLEIYRKMKPGEPVAIDNATSYFMNLFKKFERYDLDKVGRFKMNQRLNQDLDINQKENRILRKEDIVEALHELIRMNNDQNAIGDNIDHLGNRRIRSTGELLQNKFYIALTRLRRIIQDRMTSLDPSTLTPAQLINPRIITTAINQEFLNTSPLSQFMEQTNVLAELEHKRRLTGTGPGGIKLKAKSGVEIRDINSSHYGRICPINTPEGSNVGLVNELSCYARVNELGFVETPYFRVKNGKITDELVWLNALDEEKYKITHACVNYDKTGKITDELVDARIYANTLKIAPKELDFVDVSSYQILSPASALIPFIERDETHRSLMGSIMQRQAVPCVKRESPLVVTGLEEQVVKDSGQLILSKTDGTVVEVDNRHIIVEDKEGKKHEYNLYSFIRTNQNTYLKQTPIVTKGQKIKKNQPLCDNSSSINGQLALGSNLTVAYMPWYGYTFEDAIIISEKLLKQDIFTSIYIEEFESEQRETKLGPEQTTNDIPNVSEKLLKDLDEEGIIRIGAEVKSGDILVGKVSPKGEIELTPEERLMQAIFGEEAKDVKNTSLTLPHGREGRIIRNRILSRKSGDQLGVGVIKKVFVEVAELRKITVGDKLAGRHGNKGIISYIAPEEDMPFLEDGTPVDIIINALSLPNRMNLGQIFEASLGLAAEKLNYQAVVPSFDNATEGEIVDEFKKADLPPEGKFDLFDGRTGEKFTQKVTVGKLYVMKLVHMVKDKIHARSVGPYALVTQQPLKGRAHFGGQRFGEMEVWALEAYGASKALQEMLTIKSDDIISRREAYSSIIKGEDIKNPTVPAAFNVIVNELKSLCLNIETKMIKREETETQ